MDNNEHDRAKTRLLLGALAMGLALIASIFHMIRGRRKGDK